MITIVIFRSCPMPLRIVRMARGLDLMSTWELPHDRLDTTCMLSEHDELRHVKLVPLAMPSCEREI